MPNHCWNTLSVTGPKDDLLAFCAAIDVSENEGAGIIRAFLPFPAELEGELITTPDGTVIGRAFTDEGYNWCLRNWGTKWGDYDTDVLTEPHELTDGTWSVSYGYNTAWGPAVEGVVNISAMFPTLSFQNFYEEMGMGFMGVVNAEKGQHVEHTISDDELPQYPNGEDYATEEAYAEAEEAYFEKMTDLRDELLSA